MLNETLALAPSQTDWERQKRVVCVFPAVKSPAASSVVRETVLLWVVKGAREHVHVLFPPPPPHPPTQHLNRWGTRIDAALHNQ